MDKQTRERLQRLDTRLQEIFSTAFETAIERNQTALWKIENFYNKMPEWENMTQAQIDQAGSNYLMQIERSEGIIKAMLREMQNSRKTAADLIQNEKLEIAQTSYRWQVENLKGQAGSGIYFSWDVYNREQIRVLMEQDNMHNQPFTQIAFKRFKMGKQEQQATIYRLQNQLLQGMLLGESVQVIQRRVYNQFVHVPMWQARRIARTETLRTANWGRYLASKQAIEDYDIPTNKRWIATVDDRTRDQHDQMNGKIVGRAEPFVMPNGEEAMFPLDPVLSAENVINCRCIHVYVLDFAGLAERRSVGYNEPMRETEEQRQQQETDERLVKGLRRSPFTTLNNEEIEHLRQEIRAIEADEGVFIFNEGRRTGYLDNDDIIRVRYDVFPNLNSKHPRDLMSERAVLAHEYYGHRQYRNTLLPPESWNDEFRASYMAAKNAPNLSDEDRRYLILDAIERAKEAGVSIRYNEVMRRFVYGY